MQQNTPQTVRKILQYFYPNEVKDATRTNLTGESRTNVHILSPEGRNDKCKGLYFRSHFATNVLYRTEKKNPHARPQQQQPFFDKVVYVITNHKHYRIAAEQLSSTGLNKAAITKGVEDISTTYWKKEIAPDIEKELENYLKQQTTTQQKSKLLENYKTIINSKQLTVSGQLKAVNKLFAQHNLPSEIHCFYDYIRGTKLEPHIKGMANEIASSININLCDISIEHGKQQTGNSKLIETKSTDSFLYSVFEEVVKKFIGADENQANKPTPVFANLKTDLQHAAEVDTKNYCNRNKEGSDRKKLKDARPGVIDSKILTLMSLFVVEEAFIPVVAAEKYLQTKNVDQFIVTYASNRFPSAFNVILKYFFQTCENKIRNDSPGATELSSLGIDIAGHLSTHLCPTTYSARKKPSYPEQQANVKIIEPRQATVKQKGKRPISDPMITSSIEDSPRSDMSISPPDSEGDIVELPASNPTQNEIISERIIDKRPSIDHNDVMSYVKKYRGVPAEELYEKVMREEIIKQAMGEAKRIITEKKGSPTRRRKQQPVPTSVAKAITSNNPMYQQSVPLSGKNNNATNETIYTYDKDEESYTP